MPFLRVDCLICGACWNFYDEKWVEFITHTAVDYHGCVCPKCGSLGIIASGVDQNANQEVKQ